MAVVTPAHPDGAVAMLWSSEAESAAADTAMLTVARKITLGFVLAAVLFTCCLSLARTRTLAAESASRERVSFSLPHTPTP